MKVIDIKELKIIAQQKKNSNIEFCAKLKKKKPSNLDSIAKEVHDIVFSKIDCLDCANCCKNISPIIKDSDIVRISKHLKTKPASFTEKYLRLDGDGDYVYKEPPCPFLLPDNYCQIYEVRPNACKEYPHTDRRRFYQLLDLTLKNSFVCPAVYYFFELLKKEKNI